MRNNILRKGLVFIVITLFTLTSIIPSIAGEGETYFYANQDIPVQNGGISGDYTDTLNSDDTYEGISERESGGKPSKRHSYLEHKWTFTLSGSFNTINFYIEAYHTANFEGDDFIFSYSTYDGGYTDILTVTKTADDDNYQSAEFPNTLSGTIYIRVKDTDRSQGTRNLDSIFIDHMYIVGDNVPDTTPPVISDVDSFVSDNTWYNMNPEDGAGIAKRGAYCMAYNSSADRTILFAGAGGNPENDYSDTWAYNYNDNTWTDMNPASDPGNKQYTDLVYDSDNDMTITFGDEDARSKDTWSYDYAANTWTNMTDLGSYSEVGGTLAGRGAYCMAYNSSAQRIIMYGGWNGVSTYYDETWTYDASTNTWTNMSPTYVGGTMGPRWGTTMAYDSANDMTIVFGGMVDRGGVQRSNDTWSYDYTNDVWTNLTAAAGYDEIGGTLTTRSQMSIVYDPNSDRIIMACGKDDGGRINETWVYNSTDNKWYKASPIDIGGTLPEVSSMKMVYDSNASRVILFGGDDAINDFNETWTLNTNDPTAIVTWTTDEPSDSVVNYGTTTALGITESDSALVTGHQIALTDILPDTTYYFEVQSTDEASNTAVDDNGGSYYSFTTFLGPEISNVDSSVNDNTWYNMNPSFFGGVLNPRELVVMTYDSDADRTILFGGSGFSGEHKDTWAYNYNTNTWFNRNPSYSGGTLSFRSAVLRAGFAYDPDANRSILFGGWGGSTFYYNDTWAYNYTDNMWVNRSPGVSGGNLTPRGGCRLAYYDSVDRMIMFGGAASVVGTYYNETWEYNYTDNMWVNRSPTVVGSLPEVYESAMVYDSSADRIILFGGVGAGGVKYNETWVYCYGNNTWWKRNPGFVGGTLSPRQWHGMVYDSGADRTILFGGNSGAAQLNDTWMYDYSDNKWYNVSYSVGGGTLWIREAMGLAYDSSSDRTVMACGFARNPVCDVNDTWIYSSGDLIATITWTTDEQSDSVVNYGTTTALGNTTSDSNLVTSHKITLTDLLSDKTYYYEIQSTDVFGNTATDDNNGECYTFSTILDTTPPIITNVATSGITHNIATVTWTTDEPCNTVVRYGTTTDLGSMKQKASLAIGHSITLTDLQPKTTYYYEVQSTDIKGNIATDDNNSNYYSFTTEQAPINVMHVHDISMWYERVKKKYNIFAKVTIVNATDSPVEGAIVYLDIILPNKDIISVNDVTDSEGFVTFVYGLTRNGGRYKSTVTNVTKDGWTYNSSVNVETSETLQVP